VSDHLIATPASRSTVAGGHVRARVVGDVDFHPVFNFGRDFERSVDDWCLARGAGRRRGAQGQGEVVITDPGFGAYRSFGVNLSQALIRAICSDNQRVCEHRDVRRYSTPDTPGTVPFTPGWLEHLRPLMEQRRLRIATLEQRLHRETDPERKHLVRWTVATYIAVHAI